MIIPFKNFEIQTIKMADCVEELRPLREAHYFETEPVYKHHSVNVNWPHFVACEAAGTAKCYGARLVDSQQLIAYLLVYVVPSAYDSSMIASDDGYYIVPEYRGSGLARRLLQFSEKRLKELGVDYFLMSSRKPSGGANVGLLLEDEGFVPFATAYSKAL